MAAKRRHDALRRIAALSKLRPDEPRARPALRDIVTKLLAGALALAATSGPGSAAAETPVRLVPHRAVYDLSLASNRGPRGLDSARGRIVFDFTGNACEGYGLKFRQVTVLDSSDGGEKTTDLRTANFESGDGRTFRFRNETAAERGPAKVVDGSAERKAAGALAVRIRSPKRESADLDGDIMFPNAQMRELITAARAGRNTVAMKIFDGSDDGRKVYETLAIIGAPVASKPEAADALEEAARQPGLASLARWPVTISYFNAERGEQVPVYTLAFELYENGVSRALRLDYGDFALKGEMKKLELLPDTGCGATR